MSDSNRTTIVWGTVVGGFVFLVILGLMIPRIRPDGVQSLPERIRQEMMAEASVSFDAPLLELAALPVYKVDKLDLVSGQAIVGVYSWFGIKVADLHFSECKTGVEGFVNGAFACGGSSVEYYLGF